MDELERTKRLFPTAREIRERYKRHPQSYLENAQAYAEVDIKLSHQRMEERIDNTHRRIIGKSKFKVTSVTPGEESSITVSGDMIADAIATAVQLGFPDKLILKVEKL
jgi:hypothetical protein